MFQFNRQKKETLTNLIEELDADQIFYEKPINTKNKKMYIRYVDSFNRIKFNIEEKSETLFMNNKKSTQKDILKIIREQWEIDEAVRSLLNEEKAIKLFDSLRLVHEIDEKLLQEHIYLDKNKHLYFTYKTIPNSKKEFGIKVDCNLLEFISIPDNQILIDNEVSNYLLDWIKDNIPNDAISQAIKETGNTEIADEYKIKEKAKSLFQRIKILNEETNLIVKEKTTFTNDYYIFTIFNNGSGLLAKIYAEDILVKDVDLDPGHVARSNQTYEVINKILSYKKKEGQ